MAKEDNWEKEFKCPACGKNKPFFKGIVDELKKDGRVPLDWGFCLDTQDGAVFPPDQMKTLPIGATIPGYKYVEDICSECGCRYTIFIRKGDKKVGSAITKQDNLKDFQLPPGYKGVGRN